MITKEGLICSIIAVGYTILITGYAVYVEIFLSYKKISLMNLMFALLFPPFYWMRYTNIFTRPPSKMLVALLGPISIILGIYCIIFISGMLGVAMREDYSLLALGLAATVWFLMPISLAISYFISRCCRK